MKFLFSLLRMLAKIWRALPNRLVAALVFFGGLGVLFWIYASFFVLDVSTIEFHVTGAPSVTLQVQGSYRTAGMYAPISGSTGAVCGAVCQFPKMPPVHYDWTATAEGYTTATGSFDLPSRMIFSVPVVLNPTVRYEPYFPANERRAFDVRVRRDLDVYFSGSVRTVGRRTIIKDISAQTLSGAEISLAVSGGKALLKCSLCQGGWAWWSAGRWAPLFPGQASPTLISINTFQNLALFRSTDGFVLVDVTSGLVVPLSAPGNWTSVARGKSSKDYVLLAESGDAQEYNTNLLAVTRIFTGATSVAFFSDTSRIELSADKTAQFISASGTAQKWSLPGFVRSISAKNDDMIAEMADGTFRIARDVLDQVKTLAR